MKQWISLLVFMMVTTVFGADVKISQLPLGTGTSVGVGDSFPFVDATNGITKRLTLYDIANVPLISQTYAPLISPTFTGTLTLNGKAVYGSATDSTTTGSNAEMATSTRSFVRLTDSSLVSIKSIATTSVSDGYQLTLFNNTGNSITLVNSGSPSAGYAAIGSSYGTNLTLPSLGVVTLVYKSNLTKWVLSAGTHLIPMASGVSGTLPVANGGTGNTSLTANRILLGNGSSAISVAGAGVTGQVLQSNGTSADPTFSTATYPSTASSPSVLVANSSNTVTDLSGSTANRLLRTNGTAVSFSQADLTTDVSGVLPLANGGTNAAITASAGGIAYSTASAVSIGAVGSSGKLLHSNGSSAPSWAAVSMSQDVTGVLAMTNGGTNNNVTATAGGAMYSTASVVSVTAAGSSGQVLHSNGSSAPTWNAVSVSQDVTGVLAIANGGTANAISTTAGGIAYSTASVISVTAQGSSGQVLHSNGSSAPSWAAISASQDISGVVSVVNGGTGLATLTANNVMLGNGTNSPQFIAPGTTGNVLTSDGTTWTSSAPGTVSGIVSVSAAYSATTADATIFFTSTATASPPTAVGNAGKIMDFFATGTAIGTIDPIGSQTICGQTTVKVMGGGDGIRVQSDGANWQGLDGTCVLKTSMQFGSAASASIATSSCTGTCVIARQLPLAWASTPTRSSGGRYTGTVAGFSIAPDCTCNFGLFGVSTGGIGDCDATGVSTIEYVSRNNSGSASDNVVTIMCQGPR